MQPIVKALLSRPEISALVMLLVVVAGFALYAPQFASSGNIRVMLFALPELGIVALGVGILMIAGEFDLSVGSVFALSPMLMVVAMGKWGVPPELGDPAGPRPRAGGRLHQRLDHAGLRHPELRHHAGHAVHGPLDRDRALGRLPAAVPRRHADLAVRGRSRPVPRLDALVRRLRRSSSA